MSQVESYSDKAYHRINDKSKQAGRWLNRHVGLRLERNVGRVLLVAGALLVAGSGYAHPGTFLYAISPELFGIVITAVIVDYVNERRQEIERKKVLIAQLGSERRDITELAITELRNRNWLFDGSLRGAYLWEANLEKADLWSADLSKTDLWSADLSGADLGGANLSGAHLTEANLSGTYLTEANLSGAYLIDANLSGAYLLSSDLKGAHLRGTNLSGADLQWTNLSGALYWTIEQLGQVTRLDGTTMPDGVQIGKDNVKAQLPVKRPTFEEWKAEYLRRHGGTESDLRGMSHES